MTGFTCPASTASFARASANAVVRRQAPRTPQAQTAAALLAVTYDAARVAPDAESRLNALGARTMSTLSFSHLGRTVHLVSVGANRDAVAAQLRALPGVTAVDVIRRASTLTRSATLTNDPFFEGATGSASPIYQTAVTAGQWDMHVMQIEHAFSYSLGSTKVNLAIIDTGADLTHPDLQGVNVTRSRCFLLSADGSVQSTSSFVTDPNGHGTDVTGIVAAGTNNGFGFAGAAGNVSLMLYRIFPTPDDTCAQGGSAAASDPRCGATDYDIASAINDAVQNGAQVINLSLGIGQNCTNGQDPDSLEGAAIANAIANNVVVVAASGNAGGTGVEAPACDSGVIAVGATGYNDGQPNGTGYAGANTEYVTSYSQVGTADAALSPSSWGIVAPGGDAANANDADNLHWVENVWTTTPYDANFAGDCSVDPFGESGNCRSLIDGTSMAAAHVAGVAALVLAVNQTYASPSAMKQLLCNTADSIGDPNQGCGRINAYRALAVASGDPNLP
jgi:subtilisin family serine protease